MTPEDIVFVREQLVAPAMRSWGRCSEAQRSALNLAVRELLGHDGWTFSQRALLERLARTARWDPCRDTGLVDADLGALDVLLAEMMAAPRTKVTARAVSGKQRGQAIAAASESVDVGVITIRDDEFRAVLDIFPDREELVEGRRHYNIRAADAGREQQYRIAILRCIDRAMARHRTPRGT